MSGIALYLLLWISMISLSRAGISVHQGDLSTVNSSQAILSMSGDSIHKMAWWQFLPRLQSDPEAFLRYMISSPIPENQLGEYEQSCDKDFRKEIRDKQGLLATKNLSIAEFYSSENIKSVGRMKVTMWMLAFVCLSKDQTCQSLAPVILKVTPQKLDRTKSPQEWTDFRPTYYSLWELNGDAHEIDVSHTVPPRILELPIDYSNETRVTSGFRLRSFSWMPAGGVPNCGGLGLDFSSSGVGLLDKGARIPSPTFKTAAEAGFYDYEYKCYTMNEDFEKATNSSRLLVRGAAFLPDYVQTGWSSCSGGVENTPLLFSNSSGFYACSMDVEGIIINSRSAFRMYCARFDCDEAAVKASLVPYFDAVYKASRIGSNDTLIKLADTDQTCLKDPASAWVRVRGEYSRYENYTLPPCQTRRAAKKNLCLWGIDPPESPELLLKTSSEVSILNSLFQQVKTSYIQAHVSALNLEQGPPTDFWIATIALPSAFFAVVGGVVPLTDAQLKLANKLKIPKGSITTLLCCFCNLVLAFVSYSAVVAVTPTELERQKAFKTWGIHTDQVPVTSRGLRVLIFVQGESEYRSRSLVLVWVSTLVLMLLVVLITYWRSSRQKRSGSP